MGRAKTVEELLEDRERLDARINALRAKNRTKDRKRRNHALIVFGGMVEEACGGDWRSINPYGVEAVLGHEVVRGALARVVDEAAPSAEDANARVRGWEAARRDAGKAPASAD